MIESRRKTPATLKGLAATLAFGTLAGVVLAQPLTTPTRRAGWWEQTMTMNMGGRQQTMTSQMCTDAEVERGYSVFAQSSGARSCSRREVTPVPGGWHVETECSGYGGASKTTGMVTGDFQSHLHMDYVFQRARGSDHMVIDMKWLGACPAGRRPGDVVMPGGQVMNMSPAASH